MKQFVNGNNTFAYNLYANLRNTEGNLFFSPYSISTALAMTFAGARGDTEKQMAQTLHFTLDQASLHPAFANLAKHFQDIQKKGKVALTIANALWIQQDVDLVKPFLKTTEKYYGANLFQVNFKQNVEKVRLEINTWVAKQTREKITDLLAPGVLSELTRLVLTNAIYFKGNWASQFEPDQTIADLFWLTPDKNMNTPMMHQQNSFKYGENDVLQVLELPYVGEDLAMVILLPRDKGGLANLEGKLNVEQVQTWLSEASLREVEVSIPKWKLTSQFSLATTLKVLGMEDAFSDKADFSGMTSGAQLSISDVIHKAFVEVNEEGTEAAAATAGVVGVTAIMEPEPVPVFKADHPFMFLIRDTQSGRIVFLGRMVNPTE
jgi:serpin B